jgi:hypothetical protein
MKIKCSKYLVDVGDLLLRFDVGVEVSEVQEAVVLQQHVGEVRELSRFTGREEPAADLLHALPQLRVALVVLVRVVPTRYTQLIIIPLSH